MRLSSTAREDAKSTARRSSYASNVGQRHGRRSSMAASGSAPGTQRKMGNVANGLSDSINMDVLKHLESVFRSADTNGSGELDMEEFVTAFRGVLSTAEGSNDDSLRKLFMRIDANCDATVDWNEFSAYLLLEKTNSTGGAAGGVGVSGGGGQGRTYGVAEPPAQPAGSAHRDLITGLMHVDTGNGPDKWYTTGRDGTVRVWNGKDLAHLRTLQTPLPSITASSYLPASGLIALGSYTPTVLLIDPASGEQAGKMPNAASSAALSLAAWQHEVSLGVMAGGAELLAVGDADGCITVMEVLVDEVADKKSINRYYGKQVWRTTNHHDWVVGLAPMPQLSALLSASLDKTLTMTDLERRIAIKTLTGHEKSVTCCTWTGVYKMAVSGGADRQLILWNPFSCRPLGTLPGHAAPLVAVAVNERESQVISAAADKTIKVWDLRNQRCLQTFQDRTSHHPEDTVSALAYSPGRKLLVCGTYSLRAWPLSAAAGAAGCGHRDPVSWVGYNHMFSEAVSTDHAGTVCVWHVPTGRLRFAFGNTHGGCRISAATFDNNKRRLITGAEDGSVKVWNFSSGALLSTLATPDSTHEWGTGSGAEVTGLSVSSSNNARNIIATGWDRKVTWYDDSGRRTCALLRSSEGPISDVLAAALMQGYPTLATACYDGEIWLWNIESGAVRRRLLPLGHPQLPENEQPVEQLAFMTGANKHVLVAVGADRMLRCWDCFTGIMLLEHFTGHKQGESVSALALSPDNNTAVTADTSGYIMVWDLSSLKLAATEKTAACMTSLSRASSMAAAALSEAAHQSRAAAVSASSAVRRLAVWHAHDDAITALDWVASPTPAAAYAAAESVQLSLAGAAAKPNALTAWLEKDVGRSLGARTPRTPRTPRTTQGAINIASKQQQQLSAQQQPTDVCKLNSLDVTDAGQQQQAAGIKPPIDATVAKNLGFVASASLDKTLALWSTAGALVGVFGRHSWDMDCIDTWQSKTRTSLKAGEEFDMLVSSNPLSTPADSASQQQQQQPVVRLQLPAAVAAAAMSAGDSISGSSPVQLALESNRLLLDTLGSSSRLAPAASTQQTPGNGHAAGMSVASHGRPAATAPRSGSGSETATAGRNRGAQPSPAVQHAEQTIPGYKATSRPHSANKPIVSRPNSSCLRHSNSSTRPHTADQPAGRDVVASGEDSTPQNIALVCQTSMRQRQHSLQTLHSLKRQASSSSSSGAGLEADDSTTAFIKEDDGEDELQLCTLPKAGLVAAQTRDYAASAALLGAGPTQPLQNAAAGTEVGKQRPPSALQHGPRVRSSRVGFAGVSMTQVDAQQAANSRSADRKQQQATVLAGTDPAQVQQCACAAEPCIQKQQGQRVDSAFVEDDDDGPAVAEDDIPSSLWLPQFGHRPASAHAQQLFKAGGSRPSTAAAKIRASSNSSGCLLFEGAGKGGLVVGTGKTRPCSAGPRLQKQK